MDVSSEYSLSCTKTLFELLSRDDYSRVDLVQLCKILYIAEPSQGCLPLGCTGAPSQDQAADVNALDDDGYRPLDRAANSQLENKADVIQLLRSAGADPAKRRAKTHQPLNSCPRAPVTCKPTGAEALALARQKGVVPASQMKNPAHNHWKCQPRDVRGRFEHVR